MSLPERECEACGAFFIPHTVNQIYCPECGRNGARIARRVQAQIEFGKALDRFYNPVIYDHICEQCGKPFKSTSENIRYCSNRCRKQARKEALTCDNCGIHLIDLFPDIPDQELNKQYHYCSESCKQKHKEKLAVQKYGVKTCIQCGKTYSSSNEKFCCRNCMQTYKQTHKTVPMRPVKQKPPISYSEQTKKALQAFKEKQAHQIPAEQRKQQMQDDYVRENGLCSICKTPYPDCERMQSNFRIIPKGAHYKDNKIMICPKYTAP